jgi:hypothetical protein
MKTAHHARHRATVDSYPCVPLPPGQGEGILLGEGAARLHAAGGERMMMMMVMVMMMMMMMMMVMMMMMTMTITMMMMVMMMMTSVRRLVV